jgi:phytoene dehydrogenase-like protein
MRNGTLYTLRELFFGKKALLSLSEAWQLTRLLTKIFTSQHTHYDHLSLTQWLQSHTPTNAHTLRELLMLLVRLTNYANAPAQQSAGAALRQLKNGILGNVLYLDGGWQSIVEQLAATITQHNGTILQKTALQELTFANGQVTGGVTKHGQHIPAQHVILALPPKQAMAFLPQPAATALRQQHEQSIPVYTSCLDVVLQQLPNPSIRNVQGLSSPTYFSVHSAYANLQTTATSGEVVHLMKYQPEGQPIDEQATKQELLQKLSQLQPGWEKSCLYQRFLPKMVVTHAAVTPERIAQGPLLLQSKHEANGIHLVGAWNEPRAMLLDGAVASALRATDAITARQTLPLPINQDIP